MPGQLGEGRVSISQSVRRVACCIWSSRKFLTTRSICSCSASRSSSSSAVRAAVHYAGESAHESAPK